MTFHFSIHYRAQWGEDVCVELTLKGERSRETPVLLHMVTDDGNVWQTDYRTTGTKIRQFAYRYVVCRGEETVRHEWSRVPRLFDADAGRSFILDDFWMETPAQPWLFDPAFNAWAANNTGTDIHTPLFAQTIVLRVLAPTLGEGEAVALLGSQPPLGDWRPRRALRMAHTGMCEWRLSLSATALHLPFEYKYVIVNAATGELLRWEDGDNRVCHTPASLTPMPTGTEGKPTRLPQQLTTTIVRNDGLVRLPPLFTFANGADDTTDATDGTTTTDGNGAATTEAGATTPRRQPSPLARLLEMAAELNLTSVSLQTLEDVADVCGDMADLVPN
ncbi:MAG: hypothetical protein IJS59_03250 [Bacteroidaceae bacterium]|nr:hypothetical protein [Bacteroidaceae bacterium]